MQLEILEYLPEMDTQSPPLLFVHGASHGAWCWKEAFLPYFSAKGFPSYALSFRGHGASEGREKLTTYVLTDYIDDVLQVMQQLKAMPILIGHSLGGAVVQSILHSHADSLRAVVLMASTPPYGMGKEWAKIVFTRFGLVYKMYLFNTEKSPRFPDSLLFSPTMPTENREKYARLLQPESLKAAEGIIRQSISPKAINTCMPVLVLGSKEDKFLSAKIAINTAKAYKTEPIIFSDICHDMMLDPNWQTVADSILRFLSKVVS